MVEVKNLQNDIIDVMLQMSVQEKDIGTQLFEKQHSINMSRDFVVKKEEKRHNMNSLSQWNRDFIKLNHKKNELVVINKRKIVYVDFGLNIGTEINGIRPAIVYKASSYKYGEDVVVIPMTSYEENKAIDVFDIILEIGENTGIKHRSIIKTRQIRCISQKRIRLHPVHKKVKIYGEIPAGDIRTTIDDTLKKMLGLV